MKYPDGSGLLQYWIILFKLFQSVYDGLDLKIYRFARHLGNEQGKSIRYGPAHYHGRQTQIGKKGYTVFICFYTETF